MTKFRFLSTLAVICLSLFSVQSRAATIFSNFAQPGNQFGPDGVGVGAVPGPGLFLYSATNFTASFSAQLSGIMLPLAVFAGPTEVDVQLLSDSGGKPGGAMESFHLTGLPLGGPANIIAITSAAHPALNAGSQYWVSVTGGTATSFVNWGLILFAGDPVAGGATRIVNNGVDGGWALILVPESGQWPLMAIPFLSLAPRR